MTASEKVRKMFGTTMTYSERVERQKLIDAGIIGVTRHSSFDASSWEKQVEAHNGDVNWAIKEFDAKKR